jgi:hypothetical protein
VATQLQLKLSSAEARGIAKDAYVYGFPLVDNYRIQYSYFQNRGGPEYKAAWNQLYSTARVYTPDDKAVPSPNSDTPYSFLGADLRAEPLVLTFPRIESNRYFSAQFVDWYTFNFAYAGTRVTGNDGSSVLLAGPAWTGDKPPGVKAVFHCETEFAFVLYRTQLFRPSDIDNVKRIQSQYRVQTLSQFLGRPPAPSAPVIDFAIPLTLQQERLSLEFFNILNFVLQFCPAHPTERELMARFGEIGVGAHQHVDLDSLTPDVRKAMQDGIADAWRSYRLLDRQMATGEITSADVFGTRSYLKNIYLYRMLGAVDGIYGNSREETFYPAYLIDSSGAKLDGSTSRYTLRFPPGQFPPANAFWSLTMYSLPSRLLFENDIHRYLINSPMLPELQRDRDGGLTIYVQHERPTRDKETNWLPAPSGPFMMVLRLYLPKPEVYTSRWSKPLLLRVMG